MLLADGMGDSASGEAASRLAISAFVHLYLHFGKWNVRVDEAVAREVMERAERFYRQVDSVVGGRTRVTPVSPGPTTLTIAYSAGNDCVFAHVGHSRAYLYRHGKLLQLTRDHTQSGEQADPEWPLSTTPAAQDLQHMLTDAIGSHAASMKVDVEHFHLLDHDVILLCTNGLTDMVATQDIETTLGRTVTPDEQCQALVDMAIDAGGVDDASVAIARYRIPA
jgi:protein phosphatase